MPAAVAVEEEFRFQHVVDAMQGEWGDDIGLTIEISGQEARFSDGTGAWRFEEVDGALTLRGARWTGTAGAPVWEFPTGVVRRWARTRVPLSEDISWTDVFTRYKRQRLDLRRQLHDAIEAHDFSQVSHLRSAWDEHQGPSGVTARQSASLATGQFLVPGVCVIHKRFKYRGVLLACEPWCSAPTSWRAAMGVPALSRGEEQPFYHCLVDERDRPGGSMSFVAEENIEPCDVSFPLQSPLAEALLLPCEGLGGYLPGPKLERVLQRFGKGSGFAQ